MPTGNALVTGGAGFIGSELTRQLVQNGWHVVVVDNLTNGAVQNLDGVSREHCRLEIADIRNEDGLRVLLRGIHVVYHLACLGVRHSIHSPQENHDVNATATLQLLTHCRSAGVERFVHVSSSEVYGTARCVPMTEEHPTFPMTVYGASKLAGECYARAFHRTYGYPTVVVRPFNAYGPRCHHEGDSGEVIPKFLLRGMADKPMVIFGDGSQTRDFTFVRDTAAGLIQAGLCEAAAGETFNLGYGSEVTIQDLAGHVKEVLGKPDAAVIHDAPRPGDVLRLFADTRKAQQWLGYKTTIDLRTGLGILKQWYESLPWGPRELLQRETVRSWEIEAPLNQTGSADA